jgi:AraC-like DNA-binding protein
VFNVEFAYVYLYFSLIFFVNGIIQAAIFWHNKKPFNFWALSTVIAVGYIYFYLFLFHSNLLKEYPLLAGTSLLVQFTSFIAMFMMACIITPEFKVSRIHYILQLPALIGFLRLFYLRMNPEFINTIVIQSYEKNMVDFVPDQIVNTLYGIHVAILYVYLIGYYVKKLKWKNIWVDIKQGGVIFKIMIAVILFNILHLILYAGNIPAFAQFLSENMNKTLKIIMAGEAFLYFLFFQLMPPFIEYQLKQDKMTEGACQRFIQSRLDGIDLIELENKSYALLTDDRIFLDENLNLEGFSQEMGYHPKVISEYLNTVKKTRFNDFINDHRLKSVIEILRNNPEYSVTRAALDSGFNSIPTFYRLFKKRYNMSPETFRNMSSPEKSRTPSIHAMD